MAHRLVLHHYWRSSCSWRVRWALALKGVAYESRPVNLLQGEQRGADYLVKSPTGSVPCLEIDGVPVTESLAIIEWLEETYQEPRLLPQDPLSRLKVRELSLLIVAGTQPLQNLKAQKYFSDSPEARTTYAQHWIVEGLTAYETRLGQGSAGTFSFGPSVTIADLCLIPQCYNALRFGVDLERFPLINGIYHRAMATDACREAAPENQPGAAP